MDLRRRCWNKVAWDWADVNQVTSDDEVMLLWLQPTIKDEMLDIDERGGYRWDDSNQATSGEKSKQCEKSRSSLRNKAT
jgi:hypothetical protein